MARMTKPIVILKILKMYPDCQIMYYRKRRRRGGKEKPSCRLISLLYLQAKMINKIW
jgi:hypothetical protein